MVLSFCETIVFHINQSNLEIEIRYKPKYPKTITSDEVLFYIAQEYDFTYNPQTETEYFHSTFPIAQVGEMVKHAYKFQLYLKKSNN